MNERGIILGVFDTRCDRLHIERRINEMENLSRTAGIDVFETALQKVARISPSLYIGKGKAEEMKQYIEEYDIDVIIFSVPLSPVQLRNLEEFFKIKVIDRNELILDIFMKNARTNISMIETELAKYRYMLPRLTGRGIHMSRTGGGIGTRGPGEKKLEVDKRKIMKRIDILKKKISKYEQDNRERRKRRENTFTVSLIGYTNAGKSTIMNSLTKKSFLVKDKMFTTLDTTSRRLFRDIVLTDTVGFLGELPHELISSFSLTMSEAMESDLKIIVTDISDKYVESILDDVNKILNSANDKRDDRIYVFNKMDNAVPSASINNIKNDYNEALFVSAKTGLNINKLNELIIDRYLSNLHHIEIDVNSEDKDTLNYLLSHGIMKKNKGNSEKLSIYLKNNDYDYFSRNYRK